MAKAIMIQGTMSNAGKTRSVSDWWIPESFGSGKDSFLCCIRSRACEAHLYQFTNKLYNYDELANTPGGIGLSTRTGKMAVKLDGAFYAFCIWRFLFTAFFLMESLHCCSLPYQREWSYLYFR